MSNYEEYNKANEAVNKLILNKEGDIKNLEDEIRQLKQTRRMLDSEFKNKLNEQQRDVG